MNSLALVGATVYADPRSEPLSDAAVVIDGDTIVDVGRDVPRNSETIDCSGLTITAGFWNSHVYLFERQWANASTIPAAEAAAAARQVSDSLWIRVGVRSLIAARQHAHPSRAHRVGRAVYKGVTFRARRGACETGQQGSGVLVSEAIV